MTPSIQQAMSAEELHAAHITNIGSYFENILSTVSKLWSNKKTMEEFTDYFLQVIFTLYYDIQHDILFHMGGNISEWPNLNNCMIAVEISHR